MPVSTATGTTLFFYTSEDDTTTEIITSGYFDTSVDTKTPLASQIKSGDVIIIADGSTTQTVCVTSVTGSVPLTVA